MTAELPDEAAVSGDPAGVDAPLGEAVAPEEPARRSSLMRLLRFIAVSLVVGLLALLVWALLASSKGSNLVRQVADGKKPPAPPFNLTVIWLHTETWPPGATHALADGKVSLRELRGYPVVLNFFASWCVACRDEAPLLHREAQRRAGKVLFLGLDVQDLTSDARGFARKYRVNYVAVRDWSNTMYTNYGLTGVPESYFIDPRGRIVTHIPGEVTQTTLNQGIAAITSAASKGGALPGGAHVGAP